MKFSRITAAIFIVLIIAVTAILGVGIYTKSIFDNTFCRVSYWYIFSMAMAYILGLMETSFDRRISKTTRIRWLRTMLHCLFKDNGSNAFVLTVCIWLVIAVVWLIVTGYIFVVILGAFVFVPWLAEALVMGARMK